MASKHALSERDKLQLLEVFQRTAVVVQAFEPANYAWSPVREFSIHLKEVSWLWSIFA